MAKRAGYTMVPEDDPQWLRFWNAYPRRCSKKEARRAWATLQPSAELVDRIVAALEWQAPAYQWDSYKVDYAPYPATWLNGERWTDERPQLMPTPATKTEALIERNRQAFADLTGRTRVG